MAPNSIDPACESRTARAQPHLLPSRSVVGISRSSLARHASSINPMMKASGRLHPVAAYKGGRAHHETGRLLVHCHHDARCPADIRGPIHRRAHFEYPRPRAASPLHKLERRKGCDLRPRPLWLHPHHTGGHADARQFPNRCRLRFASGLVEVANQSCLGPTRSELA
jgi:hypothetical protein